MRDELRVRAGEVDQFRAATLNDFAQGALRARRGDRVDGIAVITQGGVGDRSWMGDDSAVQRGIMVPLGLRTGSLVDLSSRDSFDVRATPPARGAIHGPSQQIPCPMQSVDLLGEGPVRGLGYPEDLAVVVTLDSGRVVTLDERLPVVNYQGGGNGGYVQFNSPAPVANLAGAEDEELAQVIRRLGLTEAGFYGRADYFTYFCEVNPDQRASAAYKNRVMNRARWKRLNVSWFENMVDFRPGNFLEDLGGVVGSVAGSLTGQLANAVVSWVRNPRNFVSDLQYAALCASSGGATCAGDVLSCVATECMLAAGMSEKDVQRTLRYADAALDLASGQIPDTDAIRQAYNDLSSTLTTADRRVRAETGTAAPAAPTGLRDRDGRPRPVFSNNPSVTGAVRFRRALRRSADGLQFLPQVRATPQLRTGMRWEQIEAAFAAFAQGDFGACTHLASRAAYLATKRRFIEPLARARNAQERTRAQDTILAALRGNNWEETHGRILGELYESATGHLMPPYGMFALDFTPGDPTNRGGPSIVTLLHNAFDAVTVGIQQAVIEMVGDRFTVPPIPRPRNPQNWRGRLEAWNRPGNALARLAVARRRMEVEFRGRVGAGGVIRRGAAASCEPLRCEWTRPCLLSEDERQARDRCLRA